jgi:Fe-S-cluster-containing dehydrogenase component
MIISRKKFLKIAGISALAVPGGRLAGTCAGAMQSEGQETAAADTTQRLAMVIDLRKCAQEEGCTKCIDACHRTHNVPVIDDHNHEIHWIWKDEFRHAFPSAHNSYLAKSIDNLSVLLLCNHCDNPPCVRVCPTKATWKREKDGIVVMDWHRCIGCRYCMAACPYGSRSFNWTDPRPNIADANVDFPTRTKGVVEKCNFCEERLCGSLPAECHVVRRSKQSRFGNQTAAGVRIFDQAKNRTRYQSRGFLYHMRRFSCSCLKKH